MSLELAIACDQREKGDERAIYFFEQGTTENRKKKLLLKWKDKGKESITTPKVISYQKMELAEGTEDVLIALGRKTLQVFRCPGNFQHTLEETLLLEEVIEKLSIDKEHPLVREKDKLNVSGAVSAKGDTLYWSIFLNNGYDEPPTGLALLSYNLNTKALKKLSDKGSGPVYATSEGVLNTEGKELVEREKDGSFRIVSSSEHNLRTLAVKGEYTALSDDRLSLLVWRKGGKVIHQKLISLATSLCFWENLYFNHPDIPPGLYLFVGMEGIMDIFHAENESLSFIRRVNFTEGNLESGKDYHLRWITYSSNEHLFASCLKEVYEVGISRLFTQKDEKIHIKDLEPLIYPSPHRITSCGLLERK